MVVSTLKTTQVNEDVRKIDPNVKQWAASNPMQHVWVSASAGTGKTKVLTDRVLRLLLPRSNGQPSTPPHKILCLTYTKAAASEMTLRINKRLGAWVVMSDEDLRESLKKTIGDQPTQEMMIAARQLFAKVVDTPGGLKIMTIHAFCQSILGRFPLEAKILPQMEVLDEGRANDMLLDALTSVIQRGDIYDIYAHLSAEVAESTLIDRIKDALRDSDQLSDFFDRHTNKGAQKQALRLVFKAPDLSPTELIQRFIERCGQFDLKQFASALASGAKTDAARGGLLYDWLSKEPEDKAAFYFQFKNVFLTQSGTPFKKLSVHTKKSWEDAEDFHFMISDLILALEDQIKAAHLVELTHAILTLSVAVQDHYKHQKDARGLLDYNDLILKTYDLLQYAKDAVPWILYKLDGGLDHILVDEAQDTNPLQWKIISLLVEEFFVQQNEDAPRTLFVVGDEKQSIYRFQGAALEEFQDMRISLSKKAQAGQTAWHNESLMTSFRSTRSVLEFVDAAFHNDTMRRDIGVPETEDLEHISWRRKQAGQVSLWPLIEPDKKEKQEPWELPVVIKESQTPKAVLAEKIADQIGEWIVNKRLLPSKNRAIEPGDIMVLMRSRDAFVEHLIRALKTRFIAVSGADRLVLNNHIAVQDLLSLAKFALQPKDDLSLAEILKSPFVGMNDQQLEDIAYGRGKKTLWHKVRQLGEEPVIKWLEGVQQKVNHPPFQFFFEVLNQPCPTDKISGLRALQSRLGEDCLDVIDEFLSAVQSYQYDQSKILQSFMVWQAKNPIEIKRQFDGQENAVKIMTVHGAKGLQAPIVFLPDTLRTSSAAQTRVPRFLMPRRSGADVPIWSPRKTADCQGYISYFDKIAAQESAEYKRLFYVAATRAEDELIICGAAPRTSADENSWYYYAQNGFEYLKDKGVEEEDGALIYAHPQSGDAEEDDRKEEQQRDVIDIPQWVYKTAPEEPQPPRPLRPSRPSEEEPAFLSPRQDQGQKRFRRGLLTHTLLQFLPSLEPEQREEAGQTYLHVQATDFSSDLQQDILNEVLRVMNESDFAAIFSAQAQAEVSVSGYLPSGRLISGQIDRLLVGEDEVLVIDYKTNRPQPVDPKDVPQIYLNQMGAYKEALQKIYPQKRIRCALLWTYGPLLMELEGL